MLGTLLGNYRIVEQLDEGGMGVVYIGRHEQLGRRVVVKVLRPEMTRSADMVQRFFNEAQAATAIRNPGIAQVFDYGTTPAGRVYFVMELLDGESLTSRLKKGRLDYVACCRIGRQIANVLQAAHSAGITHRDLKPDNLFLVPDPEVLGGERVKVLDFGIAKLTGELHTPGVQTRTGLVMGTPNYMSPEQCRGASNADARSDIYSLGCILFRMACDRTPFIGVGLGDIVGAHLYVAPPDPQSLAPDLPPALSRLILHLLAKKPDERPQTMAAVSQSLDEILRALGGSSGGVPIRQAPASQSRPLPGLPPNQPHAPAHARPPTPLPVHPSASPPARPPTPLPVHPSAPPSARPPTPSSAQTPPRPLASFPPVSSPPARPSSTTLDQETTPFPLASSKTLSSRETTPVPTVPPKALEDRETTARPPLSSKALADLETSAYSPIPSEAVDVETNRYPYPAVSKPPADRETAAMPPISSVSPADRETAAMPPISSVSPADCETAAIPLSPSTKDDHDTTLVNDPAEETLDDHGPAPSPAPSPAPQYSRAPTPLPVPSPALQYPRAPTPLPVPSSGPQYPRAPTPLPVPSSGPQYPRTPTPLPVPSSGPGPQYPRAPTPLPVPQLRPSSTTISASAGTYGVSPVQRALRRPFILGGLALGGVVSAIVIALSSGDSASPPPAPDTPIVDPPPPVDAGVPTPVDAAVAPPPLPVAVDAAAPSTAELETECQELQTAQKWSELEQCADRLMPLSPERAAELKTRASGEAKSAPRITAFESALRDKNLKRARAELDQVWPASLEYPNLKAKYDLAESQAITDLAAQLDRVKDADCEEYNALLKKERALKPSRVTTEAARRTPCSPPKCLADAYAEKGQQQYAAKQLAGALASYEAAYACRPSPDWSEKSFIIACNLKNLTKAKLHWKRLPLSMKTRTVGVCVRNGITESSLNVL